MRQSTLQSKEATVLFLPELERDTGICVAVLASKNTVPTKKVLLGFSLCGIVVDIEQIDA
jgi:hypothetical protein